MKRLTLVQFASLKLLITGLIAADLFAFWVWVKRPPRIYSDLLGLDTLHSETPFLRLVNWAHWNDGPRTPSGFLMLFDPGELVFCGVLLLALILLIVFLFAPREPDTPMWRRMSAKVSSLQFRVRTAVVLIAIIGVYTAWEVHAWRTWRLRSDHLRAASQNSLGVESSLSALRSMRDERPYIRGTEQRDESARRVLRRTTTAKERGIAVKDLKKLEIDVLLAKLLASTEEKLKHQRAAANPLASVARELYRPSPRTEKDAADWLGLGDPGRALAVYDDLARMYPDLVEAHSRSAWLRATSSDAQYRDGKLAVESARRACELTDWRNPDELEVLAASYAEAGEFKSAVNWQHQALALTIDPADVESCQQRLALYRAGKPFRQQADQPMEPAKGAPAHSQAASAPGNEPSAPRNNDPTTD